MLPTLRIIRQLSLVTLIACALLPRSAAAENRPLKSVRGITFKQVQFLPAASQPLPALETAMRQAFPDYVSQARTDPKYVATYYYSLIDLNGDGKAEAIVYPLGPYFCGSGGCTLMIFQPVKSGYRLIGQLPVSRSPVIVTNQKTNGWQDLIRPTAGGGLPLNYSYLRYRQGEYVETDEVPKNTAVSGKAVLGDEMAIGQGLMLKAK